MPIDDPTEGENVEEVARDAEEEPTQQKIPQTEFDREALRADNPALCEKCCEIVESLLTHIGGYIHAPKGVSSPPFTDSSITIHKLVSSILESAILGCPLCAILVKAHGIRDYEFGRGSSVWYQISGSGRNTWFRVNTDVGTWKDTVRSGIQVRSGLYAMEKRIHLTFWISDSPPEPYIRPQPRGGYVSARFDLEIERIYFQGSNGYGM